MAESKQEVLTDIARLIGMPQRQVATGSTEPRDAFVDVLRALGSELDKPSLAQFIALGGGQSWDETCDSRGSASGGGGTVTVQGLRRVRDAVKHLLRRD